MRTGRSGGNESGRASRLSMLSDRTTVLDTCSAKPPVKTANPFYLSPEWRALVAEIIRERGARCEDQQCGYPGRTGIRVFGDRIIELQDGGAPLDKANVMLRCGSCHAQKTNRERARRTHR
jgi:5-methylcytosine-specific restriction enzyme A